MLRNIWGLLPQGFRERPFDAYTALSLIVVGFYALLDTSFPESQTTPLGAALFFWIAIYLIVASVVLLTALFANQKTCYKFHYFGQMYAWMFIAAAGISVCFYQLWSGVISNSIPITNLGLYWIIFFIWGAVGWAAFVRSLEMYLNLRRTKQ
jgi:hypothetical protein